MKRRFQISFLKSQRVPRDRLFVDIGCGTLRGGIPIIRHLGTGQYVGFDVRPEVLPEALAEIQQRRLESKRPQIRIVERLADIELPQPAATVWAFSVLIHLDDDALEDCFTFVGRSLADDGRFYANMNIGASTELGNWKSFPVMRRSLEEIRAVAAEHGLVTEVVGMLNQLGHNSGIESQDSQQMLKFTQAPPG